MPKRGRSMRFDTLSARSVCSQHRQAHFLLKLKQRVFRKEPKPDLDISMSRSRLYWYNPTKHGLHHAAVLRNVCVVYRSMASQQRWLSGPAVHLGCGASGNNGCYCNPHHAISATNYINSCITAGCAKASSSLEPGVNAVPSLYNAYCSTALAAPAATSAAITAHTAAPAASQLNSQTTLQRDLTARSPQREKPRRHQVHPHLKRPRQVEYYSISFGSKVSAYPRS